MNVSKDPNSVYSLGKFGYGNFGHIIEKFQELSRDFNKELRVDELSRRAIAGLQLRSKGAGFFSRSRIDINKMLPFLTIDDMLIQYFDKQPEKNIYEGIIVCQEELIAVEEIFGRGGDQNYYILAKISIEEIAWKAATKACRIQEVKNLKNLLNHNLFVKYLSNFIKKSFTLDDLLQPLLYKLPEPAMIAVLELIKGKGDLDENFKRNLFIYSAVSKKYKLVEKLVDLFPNDFQSNEEEIIEKLIISGQPLTGINPLILKVSKKLDYYDCFLQIAQKKLDSDFYQQFEKLCSKDKKILFEAAFAYNNPFLHEPADVLITPDQYSINLMWINKDKMGSEQEFLLGNGYTSEEKKLDFQKRFVSPISKWALANPGSMINIWIDSKMATSGAIERSRAALMIALEGQSSGKIQFKDVRTIETVNLHQAVFTEKMPVYFRVDLLRAIAADHVLKNQENQFFVYGDIDMEPLSADKLFDKKTLTFLDDFGFVMAKGGHLGFENGFQILKGDNLGFMNSHRKVIIDLSLEMAVKRTSAIKEQQIYDTYPAMLAHFLDEDGRYGRLKSEKEGTAQFRFDKCGSDFHDNLIFGDKKISLREIMPTKPVVLPPSHF